jgi:hypothetical protein
MTAVRLNLTSGEQRVIDKADGALLNDPFFIITRWYPDLRRHDTVLTLRAQDVVFAKILRDGSETEYILGTGGMSK